VLLVGACRRGGRPSASAWARSWTCWRRWTSSSSAAPRRPPPPRRRQQGSCSQPRYAHRQEGGTHTRTEQERGPGWVRVWMGLMVLRGQLVVAHHAVCPLLGAARPGESQELVLLTLPAACVQRSKRAILSSRQAAGSKSKWEHLEDSVGPLSQIVAHKVSTHAAAPPRQEHNSCWGGGRCPVVPASHAGGCLPKLALGSCASLSAGRALLCCCLALCGPSALMAVPLCVLLTAAVVCVLCSTWLLPCTAGRASRGCTRACSCSRGTCCAPARTWSRGGGPPRRRPAAPIKGQGTPPASYM
jgi:hypothetical protein